MPWNFTSDLSSSPMAPVSSSRRVSARVPRRPSLACLIRSVSDRFLFSIILFTSVDIFYITARLFQLVEIGLGLGRIFVAFFLNNGEEGILHVYAHRLFGAADKDVCTGLQPRE